MRLLPRPMPARELGARLACALVVVGLSLGLSLRSASAIEGEALRYAYTVPAPPSGGAAAVAQYRCRAPVEPMLDMSDLFGFYQPSSTMSVIDREAMSRYVKRNASVERFKSELLRMQIDLISAREARPAIARCIQTWLASWAASGAMTFHLDKNNAVGHRQAVLIQIWASVAFTNAFATSEAAIEAGDRQSGTILPWLRHLSDIIVAEFTPVPGRSSPLRWLEATGNQSHWAALAVAQIAVLTNDRARLIWALEERERALRKVNADGSFINEMRRGGKAVHYQNFAMLPLSLLTAIADANGVRLGQEFEHRLQTAAIFSLAAARSPEEVEKRVGRPQDIGADALDWAEVLIPHMRKFAPDLAAELDVAINGRRPVRSAFIGLALSDVDFFTDRGQGPH